MRRRMRHLMLNKKSGGHMHASLETMTVMALCTVDARMTKLKCKLPLLHHMDNQDLPRCHVSPNWV